jgi:hypothetical protein
MVTMRIKATLKSIEAADPTLGHHLATSVRTGTYTAPPDCSGWTF